MKPMKAKFYMLGLAAFAFAAWASAQETAKPAPGGERKSGDEMSLKLPGGVEVELI